MLVLDETTGTITLTQGDAGEIIINGLSTDKEYTVYFAIQDKNRRPVGFELSVEAHQEPTVKFKIPSILTDLLKVPLAEETETYHYGIKICDAEGGEDTLIIGNGDIGSTNDIIVYPKKVEGD